MQVGKLNPHSISFLKFIYRDIFGEKARLAEILSEDDQATVLGVMLEAEKVVTENPELTYWFSGLRDEDDDGVWEWANSE